MNNLKFVVLGILLGGVLTYYFTPKNKTKIVTQTKEKIRTITKVVHKSDGTRVEYITKVEHRDSKASKTVVVVAEKKYSLGLSQATWGGPMNMAIYQVDLAVKVLPRTSVSVYGRTDGEIGLGLRLEF